MTDDKKNLYYLDDLSDYKVSSDDPDVRGWDVKDSDNRVIGKVDNLLVNKERERVVYLDVQVDQTIIDANHDPYGKPASADVHEFINREGENHIIIPVGLVRLNQDQKYVYTDRIDHQTFAETKRKERRAPVDRDYEEVVLESYDRFGDPDKRRNRDSGDTSYTGRSDQSGTHAERRKKGNIPDDDSFYDRDEFDHSNYRKKR